ncbi:unnamed protein product, partial [Vitis vinifera]
MLLDNILKYNYSFSKDESYFNYSLYNSSIISRVVLDVSGQIKQMTWIEDTHQWKLFWSQPRRQCQVYAYCGPSRICNLDSYELPEYPLTLQARVPWIAKFNLLVLYQAWEDLLLFDFSDSSEDTNHELSEANKGWRGEKKEVDLPMFSCASVSIATNNFSIENKLGEGGFGPVYKVITKRI